MNFLDYSSEALANLSKYNAIITVGSESITNPMTIGWGQIGIACGKPAFVIMVRRSRYSKELIDKNPVFTVNIPKDDSFKDAIAFCGSKSGCDFDKMAECKLTSVPSDTINVAGIKGFLTYECRIIYSAEMTEEHTVPEIVSRCYKNGDYHTLYTGEILNIKEN